MPEKELKSGQVLTITSSNGKLIDEVDLKLLDTSLLKLIYNEEENSITIEIEDTNMANTYLSGELDISTITDFSRALVNISKRLTHETNN